MSDLEKRILSDLLLKKALNSVRVCRSVLTGLKVDPAALLSVETNGQIKALIVTMKGNRNHFKVFYVGLVLKVFPH